jgi:thioester reductase-like protein
VCQSCVVSSRHSAIEEALIVNNNVYEDGSAVESQRDDPSCAMGIGYAESRWVAERILAQASASTPILETVSVRVGQLSGGLTGA